MKKNRLKILIGVAALVLATILLTPTARAGFGGYSPYNINTNNGTTIAPNTVPVYGYAQLNPIAFTATATNLFSRSTNVIYQYVTITNQYTFVYDSGIYGTNFSTNFPPLSFVITNNVGFKATAENSTNNVQETFN